MEQVRVVWIYALFDPRIVGWRSLRYVGKTTNLVKRLEKHNSPSGFHEMGHCGNWLRNLRAAGLKPEMFVLEKTDSRNWGRRERYWINKLRVQKFKLTNIADGGPGAGYSHVIRPRNRRTYLRAVSASHLEAIRKAAAKRRGVPVPEERKKRISAAMKGKQNSLGNRVPPIHRFHLSEALKKAYAEGRRTCVIGRSEVRGVVWDQESRKWKVTIKGKNLGRFVDKEAAIAARQAAIELGVEQWKKNMANLR